jgi:hypothetical protein
MESSDSMHHNITPSMLEMADHSKYKTMHIAYTNAQEQQSAPFNIEKPQELGITTKIATQEIFNVISKDITKDASGANINHVYYIQNTLNTLQFLHSLLIWTIEILSTQKKTNSENDENHSAKRSKMSDDCEYIPLRKGIKFPGYPGYNPLTAATLALRSIRHEYLMVRNTRLLDNARLYYFIRQMDDTIVKCLKEAGFLARDSPEAFPPNEILDSIGISRELCILANIHLLYHTPGVFPEKLFKNGIDIRYSKIGSFGRGAYFTNNAYKAMTYFRSDWDVKPDEIHPDNRYVTVSLVSLGRIKTYSHLENHNTLFREPDGYDSVMGSPKDVNEITVFNAGKILLSYVVYYKIDNQPTLPSVIKPNGFIIPQALKKFFNQLIQRAESIDIGSDMRITIENLIKKTITPTEFAIISPVL